MPRILTVGAAQLGPIARAETRRQVVARLLALMRQARAHGCDLTVQSEAGQGSRFTIDLPPAG